MNLRKAQYLNKNPTICWEAMRYFKLGMKKNSTVLSITSFCTKKELKIIFKNRYCQ